MTTELTCRLNNWPEGPQSALKVINHWNQSDIVGIVIPKTTAGESFTLWVQAHELWKAIRYAQNQ